MEPRLQRSRNGLRLSRIPASGRVHPRITSAIDASRGGGRPAQPPAGPVWEQRLARLACHAANLAACRDGTLVTAEFVGRDGSVTGAGETWTSCNVT